MPATQLPKRNLVILDSGIFREYVYSDDAPNAGTVYLGEPSAVETVARICDYSEEVTFDEHLDDVEERISAAFTRIEASTKPKDRDRALRFADRDAHAAAPLIAFLRWYTKSRNPKAENAALLAAYELGRIALQATVRWAEPEVKNARSGRKRLRKYGAIATPNATPERNADICLKWDAAYKRIGKRVEADKEVAEAVGLRERQVRDIRLAAEHARSKTPYKTNAVPQFESVVTSGGLL